MCLAQVNHPNVVHTYMFEVARLTEASFMEREPHTAHNTTSSTDSTVGLDRTQVGEPGGAGGQA